MPRSVSQYTRALLFSLQLRFHARTRFPPAASHGGLAMLSPQTGEATCNKQHAACNVAATWQAAGNLRMRDEPVSDGALRKKLCDRCAGVSSRPALQRLYRNVARCMLRAPGGGVAWFCGSSALISRSAAQRSDRPIAHS